jgi:hypothetical protein
MNLNKIKIMTKKEKIIERLNNMSEWTIEDFAFYADMFDRAFVFGVEFNEQKPEIGWSLFQGKLEEAKKEFEHTGDVAGFQIIDDLDEKVQERVKIERQQREN